MVDIFTLALTHGLLAVALWRLLSRPDLDSEQGADKRDRPWLRKRGEKAESSVSDA